MAYLCSQEIEAAENNDSFVLDKAKEMQQKMLTEHLRHFVPAFAESSKACYFDSIKQQEIFWNILLIGS